MPNLRGRQTSPPDSSIRIIMKKWQCIFCGFVYDEALGIPNEGVAPGTTWADFPEDWMCPECGATKADFQMIEI